MKRRGWDRTAAGARRMRRSPGPGTGPRSRARSRAGCRASWGAAGGGSRRGAQAGEGGTRPGFALAVAESVVDVRHALKGNTIAGEIDDVAPQSCRVRRLPRDQRRPAEADARLHVA